MKLTFALLMTFSMTAYAAPVMLTQQNCSWDNPGANRYTGTISDAMDYYLDIPKSTREKLKTRISKHDFDDQVEITRDQVKSKKEEYSAEITEMHFGSNLVCKKVTRTRWLDTGVQRAFVYCEDGHCIIVPFICGNVSRIEKIKHKPIAIPPGESPNYSPPWTPLAVQPTPVPEPGSALLLALGFASLIAARRK